MWLTLRIKACTVSVSILNWQHHFLAALLIITDYGFHCSYDREERPRGRASMKRARVDSVSSSNNDQPGGSTDVTSDPSGHASYGSTQAPPETAAPLHPAAQSVSIEVSHQRSSLSLDQDSRNGVYDNTQTIHNPRPVHQTFPEYLQIQQELTNTQNYHSFYFDDGNLNNFSHLDFYGNGLQGMPATIYSAAAVASDAGPVHNLPASGDRPRTISRIGFVVPNTPHFRPQSAFPKSPIRDVPSNCKYTVLAPLMQHIGHIISPPVACHLLDLYFAEPSSSLFESASPYVLSM